MPNDRIGFIGGGQMAQALARGAVANSVVGAEQIVFAEPDKRQRDRLKELFPGSSIVVDGREVLQVCERTVLAVKPHVLKSIASQLVKEVKPQHLLVSIVAGIELSQLRAMFGTERVVRVMPNTPAQIGAGACAISADPSLAETDWEWVETLMRSVGIAVRAADHHMHAVTAICGSSPAYIYLVIEALSDGGVAAGLPREMATRLAAQSVLGAAKMVLDTGLHPGQLKDQVTSPGGTTIAAIRELEKSGVRSAFIEAVLAATRRSQELS